MPPARFAVVYHLLSITHNHRLRLKTFCAERRAADRRLRATTFGTSADWFEREAFDLYGILFRGHPDLRRLLTDYGFIGHPFRKDFPLIGNVEMRYDPAKGRVVYEPVSIEPRTLVPKVIRDDAATSPTSRIPAMPEIQNFTLNFGPQHPAAHGVLRLVLELDGEVIQKADPHVGLLHRATEKLAESKPFNQSIGYMDRLDYVSMMCNEHGYVLAIEQLLGIDAADARAVHPRDVRRDHADPESPDVARRARPRHRRDGDVPLLLPRARGPHGLLRGGLGHAHARDVLPAGRRVPRPAGRACRSIRRRRTASDEGSRAAERGAQRLAARFHRRFHASAFRRNVDEYETLLTDNRIWKQRTVNIGVVSPERAMQLGFSGPMLRGSGIVWDLRKKQPYEVYDKVDFDIPVGVNGDCYDRYLVRVEEMRQSNRIIKQCVDWLRVNPGPVMLEDRKVAPPSRIEMKDDMESLDPSLQTVHRRLHRVPEGESYAAVEHPKGEFGVYIVSDGSNKPYRLKVRAPGFPHLAALNEMVVGHMLADVVAVIGTQDIVFGEIDR